MKVSRDDKDTYYLSVGPSDVKGFNRVTVVTRMTDPAPFALNDRLSEAKQRRSAAIRNFMARCYAVRRLPYDENR